MANSLFLQWRRGQHPGCSNRQRPSPYHGHEMQPALQMTNAETIDPLPDQSEPVNGQLYRYIARTLPEISIVAWSPDGQWIAPGAPRKTIYVWSAE